MKEKYAAAINRPINAVADCMGRRPISLYAYNSYGQRRELINDLTQCQTTVYKTAKVPADGSGIGGG